MKTFEEKWTAWLDNQLSGNELSEFEAALPDKAAAQAEKAEAKRLGELLKRELSTLPLRNEEFFSHQLRERIVQESSEQHRQRPRVGGRFRACYGRVRVRSRCFWFASSWLRIRKDQRKNRNI